MKQRKLGLSIRGAGAKGMAYIGVFKALQENGIEVDYIIGTSAGAIMGASLAIGMPIDDMIKFSKGFTNKRMMGMDSLRDGTIWSDDKLLEYSHEAFGDKLISDTNIPLFIQVTEAEEKKPVILEAEPIYKSLVASCAMIPLLKPIEINGKHYFDGGYTCGYDANFLREKGADVVVGMAADHKSEKGDHDIGVFESIDLIVQTRLKQDLVTAPVDLLLDNLGSADVSVVGFKEGLGLIEHGYNVAQSKMEDIENLLELS